MHPTTTPMRRLVTKLAIAAILLLFQAAAALAQPKISVDKTEIPFGTVYNGASQEVSFKISNTGTDSLRIYDIDVSCGCTNVSHYKPVMGPGQSQSLTILFNSSGFVGNIKKAIDIKTNDPANPNQRIVFTVDVKEELQIAEKPRIVWLGEYKAGQTVKRDIAFVNISNHPITLTGWSSSSRALSVRLSQKTVNPKQRIVVSLTGQFDYDGFYTDYVYLQTDSDGQSVVPFPVNYSVIGK